MCNVGQSTQLLAFYACHDTNSNLLCRTTVRETVHPLPMTVSSGKIIAKHGFAENNTSGVFGVLKFGGNSKTAVT